MKKFYIEHLPTGLPIFHQPFWLNAVAGDDWDVATVIKNNKIVASMPYVLKSKIIRMPLLTQFLGPFYTIQHQKKSTEISTEIELLNTLIEQLPPFDYFEQKWNYSYSNWLPFYWSKFEQTTKYTYILQNIKNTNLLWENFKGNIRWDIQKAEKNNLKIEISQNVRLLYELVRSTYEIHGINSSYDLPFLEKIFKSCIANEAGKIYSAIDKDQNIHSSIFVIWDQASAYYLVGGVNNNFRNSGATSYLLWHAMKECSKKVDTFDFEGSMIPGIEQFFRAFSAVQKPYFEITKTNSRVKKIGKAIKIIKEIF